MYNFARSKKEMRIKGAGVKKILGVLMSFILIFSLSSCVGDEFVSYTYLKEFKADAYFNTASTVIVYYDKKESGAEMRAKNALKSVNEFVSNVEMCLSSEYEGGDISRFNAAKPNEKIKISEITYDALSDSKRIYSLTDGAYNPTVSMLVDLWGFSPRFLNGDYVALKEYDRVDYTNELPSVEYINAFKELTAFEQVILEEKDGEYFMVKPDVSVVVNGVEYDMKIDLGGYGKGYAADGAAKIIREFGLDYGYVSFGGSSMSLLKCPVSKAENGKHYDWKINFIYPTKEESLKGTCYGNIYGNDCGISTSGDYERFYEINGKRYSHIIDPSTGYPINNGVTSVSIAGGSAAENDALTTALSVMGTEKAVKYVNEHLTDRNVSIVLKDGEKFKIYTNVEKKNFSLNYSNGRFDFAASGNGTGKIQVG